MNEVLCGDALEMLRTLPDYSVDSIVTDPPAGISFMGKAWDHHKGGRDEWIKWMETVAFECLRVLKPGGHALVWALPRTSHWTATAWENAGFEVRDRIGHIFGSGFPKSLDVSKAIDKEAGVERDITQEEREAYRANGNTPFDMRSSSSSSSSREKRDNPRTPAAILWNGWGTALKPAVEDWWLLRKPISENTVAANVLKWGTGALNIDRCRVDVDSEDVRSGGFGQGKRPWQSGDVGGNTVYVDNKKGRFPVHLIHDGSEEVMAVFPEQKSGAMTKPYQYTNTGNSLGAPAGETKQIHESNSGSASRFFYTAKASRRERERGLKGMEVRFAPTMNNGIGGKEHDPITATKKGNHHPTVKPLALMEYLVRLITPPGGTVLDCFCGSGTTLIACIREGFEFIGIDSDPEYVEIAKRRTARWSKDGKQLTL